MIMWPWPTGGPAQPAGWTQPARTTRASWSNETLFLTPTLCSPLLLRLQIAAAVAGTPRPLPATFAAGPGAGDAPPPPIPSPPSRSGFPLGNQPRATPNPKLGFRCLAAHTAPLLLRWPLRSWRGAQLLLWHCGCRATVVAVSAGRLPRGCNPDTRGLASTTATTSAPPPSLLPSMDVVTTVTTSKCPVLCPLNISDLLSHSLVLDHALESAIESNACLLNS